MPHGLAQGGPALRAFLPPNPVAVEAVLPPPLGMDKGCSPLLGLIVDISEAHVGRKLRGFSDVG